MSHFFYYLYVTAGVVFLFGAAIFVHEFGHFWVALKLGLKVEEFAIGFGPKICSWTRNGVVYSLRWILAGGYVKLPQMMTSSTLEGANTKDQPPLPPAPALSKIAVAVAGPAMNVVFAFAIAALIYFIGLPVPINPSYIGYVDPHSPEGKLGIQSGDRIVAIEGKPVKSWDDINTTTILALTNVLQVTIVHPASTNGAPATTHVYALRAYVNNVIGLKTLNLEPREHLIIGAVKDDSAAAAAGIMPNDEILAFAGVPIGGSEELTNLVQACRDKKAAIVVKRGEQRLTLEVTPRFDPSAKCFFLGILFAPADRLDFAIEHPTPWSQVQHVWNQLCGTVVALVHSHDSGVKAKDLSGPVGIFTMLALQFNTDYRLALSFLVMLNINLALLNMLPLPVLDGGHVVMSILERIRRRPLEVRIVESMTTVFAVLLIIFMIYISCYDVGRLHLFRSLFGMRHNIEQTTKPADSPSSSQPAP